MIAPLFFIISLLTKPVGGAESWQAVWEKTVKAAKEEGQVTIYGRGAPMLPIEAGVLASSGSPGYDEVLT